MAGMGRRVRVLPDGSRVEEAMVRAAEAHAFVDGADYLSLSQLVAALGDGASERRPCSPLTARVIVWACARALGEGPYGSFVQEPAFARAALELFFDLKSGGVDPAGFRAAVDRFPAGRIERARYLARLFEAYEARLGELRLQDREDRVHGAVRALDERGLPDRLRKGVLEVSGVHDFPITRRTLLQKLARACDAAGSTFRLEVPAGCSPDVDAVVDPVLGALERSAQGLVHVELEKEDLTLKDRPLAWLGRFLFSSEAPRVPEADVPLRLHRVATARGEAQLFARLARQQVDEGVPPERLALVWPDLAEEAEWAAEALERYGVPARMRRGMPLSATAPGRIALELPLVVDDGFPASEVGWLLESRYLPQVSHRLPEGPRGLLALAGVRDDGLGAKEGRGAYEVRLSALEARLSARGAGKKAAEVGVVREAAGRLIAVAGAIPAEGKASELLERWWGALDALGLPSAVRKPEPRDREGTVLGRAVLRALARDQAAFEALHGMAQELRGALRDAGALSAKMTRRTFQRWLVDAAGDFNLAPRGPRGGGVQIFDVRELPGRTFDHVYLGGFSDGRFPRREVPSPLFPEEDRIRVNAWFGRDVFRVATGEGERRIGWRLAEDRLLLHLALSASEGAVTCAHPAHGPSGGELAPSPFWDELQRLTGGRPSEVPLRAVPGLDEVLSEGELRQRAALELWGRPELRTGDPDPAGPSLGAAVKDEPWVEDAARVAAIEAERLAFFGAPKEDATAGPYTGSASREDLGAALEACFAFDRSHPLSASLLQRFGNCAFQGFLGWAVGLDDPEEPGEEMDARGQGSFWHKVLEVLFPLLKEEGLLGAAPEDVPSALIDRALVAAGQAAEQTGHTGHPALWRIGHERARRMVRRVLGSPARGLPFHHMEPVRPELLFGSPEADEAWREIPIPGPHGEPPVYVRGKIDRLDGGNGQLGVVDYKSGEVKKNKGLREAFLATEFQLPLYLHAARVAGHPGQLKAAWLSLKDGEPTDLEGELAKMQLSLEDLLATDAETTRRLEGEGLQNLSMAVHRLVAGLRQGRFPAQPEDCKFCNFARVCRISERRMPEGGE